LASALLPYTTLFRSTSIYSILALKRSMMGEENNHVTLQTIGNGDAFGSGGHFQTCFYVHSNRYHFLVDCGATSLVAMKRFQIPTDRKSTRLNSSHAK